MARLTLRLPESLHRQLKEQANLEGVSLNQYIVYTLTRQATSLYMVYPHSEEEMVQREARFATLRQSLRKGSDEEISAALTNREVVEPEPALTTDMMQRVRQHIKAAKEATASSNGGLVDDG